MPESEAVMRRVIVFLLVAAFTAGCGTPGTPAVGSDGQNISGLSVVEVRVGGRIIDCVVLSKIDGTTVGALSCDWGGR